MAHTWTIARGPGTNLAKVIVVELVGADGTVGLGEASPIKRYKESIDTVEAFCRDDPRGLSFTDIEGSMTYLDTLSDHDMAAKCAINIALLDAAGKKAKKPIYDLLGLGFRENAHITSFTIGIDKPDVIRQKVLEAEKFPVLKVKVGVAGRQSQFAGSARSRPDKNHPRRRQRRLEDERTGAEMIEWLAADKHIQYHRATHARRTPHKDWIWLKQRSPLPIFADESYHIAPKTSTRRRSAFMA